MDSSDKDHEKKTEKVKDLDTRKNPVGGAAPHKKS
jgi:hypothetical protein